MQTETKCERHDGTPALVVCPTVPHVSWMRSKYSCQHTTEREGLERDGDCRSGRERDNGPGAKLRKFTLKTLEISAQ